MEENSEVKKFPGVRELEAYLATLPSSELIYMFNKKVEVETQVRARAHIIACLGTVMLQRFKDCSAVIQDGMIYLNHPIKLVDGVIILCPKKDFDVDNFDLN